MVYRLLCIADPRGIHKYNNEGIRVGNQATLVCSYPEIAFILMSCADKSIYMVYNMTFHYNNIPESIVKAHIYQGIVKVKRLPGFAAWVIVIYKKNIITVYIGRVWDS